MLALVLALVLGSCWMLPVALWAVFVASAGFIGNKGRRTSAGSDSSSAEGNM